MGLTNGRCSSWQAYQGIGRHFDAESSHPQQHEVGVDYKWALSLWCRLVQTVIRVGVFVLETGTD